ncbi:unnamed protein product [Caretta caretta]
MEKTTHCMLVRKGAVAFARKQDFTIEEHKNLMTKQSAEAYQGEAGAASSVPFRYCMCSQRKDSIEELVQQPY